MKSLELVLIQDIPTLGNKGNIIKVKYGYGRNYLIPKGLALQVCKENLHRVEIDKKRNQKLALAHKEEVKKIAEDLELRPCRIVAKANEESHLFGSVTYAMIAEGFQKMGIDVKPENIELQNPSVYPIKQLGIYPLYITLHPEIVAKGKVWIDNEPKETNSTTKES